MLLKDVCENRDNNLNLMRMVAATAVLISHCVPLTDPRAREPLMGLIGMSLGSVAVDVFFLTSGFLVTRSLLLNQNVGDFLRSRVLRIYPALMVMLLLVVFGVGLVFTNLEPGAYLSEWQPWKYLVRNAVLVAGVVYKLPGVFAGNPYPATVNGSLWTLPYEVRLYLALLLLWWVCVRYGQNKVRAFQVAVVSTAACLMALVFALHLAGVAGSVGLHLAAFFFSGGAFYVLRGNIRLTWPLMGGLITMLGLAVGLGQGVFFGVYILTLGWLVLHLAYLPAGPIRRYNQLGDYSYGMYIYAFPVQQCVAALFPGLTFTTMVLWSLPTTLVLGVLSWHCIEKPALRWKSL